MLWIMLYIIYYVHVLKYICASYYLCMVDVCIVYIMCVIYLNANCILYLRTCPLLKAPPVSARE